MWVLLAQALKIDYTGTTAQGAISRAAGSDPDLLLDLVDARLHAGRESFHDADAFETLKTILFMAGSGWELSANRQSLVQVVDATVRDQVAQTTASAEPSASEHLSKAWSATYGRDRNPTLAHAEMVRAVESAARPQITPKDLTATLGTIIGQLDSQAALYTTAGASDKNDGVAGVVAMMRMLWQQQTDRHGSNPTIPATQERVEFLMPIAAALVHAFSNGSVRRR